MVGEIRDRETAEIAIQASLTGHLVLSTLHTNDGASSITRLLEMGVEPYLISLTEEAKPYTLFQHAGVEFIYMLTGKVLYRHADKVYPLKPGDSLFFDAGALHGPEELTEFPMSYLSIIVYPRA